MSLRLGQPAEGLAEDRTTPLAAGLSSIASSGGGGSGPVKSRPWASASLARNHAENGSFEVATRSRNFSGAGPSYRTTARSDPSGPCWCQTRSRVTPPSRIAVWYSARRAPSTSSTQRLQTSSFPGRIGAVMSRDFMSISFVGENRRSSALTMTDLAANEETGNLHTGGAMTPRPS